MMVKSDFQKVEKSFTRCFRPELFETMPWSTDRVLPLTLERARHHGLRTHVLPAWFDVDTAADLVRLRDALAEQSTGPPRTMALIREMAGAGVFAGSPVTAPPTSRV